MGNWPGFKTRNGWTIEDEMGGGPGGPGPDGGGYGGAGGYGGG